MTSAYHPRNGGAFSSRKLSARLPHSSLQFSKPPPPASPRVTLPGDLEIGVSSFEGQGWQVQGIQLVCRGGSGYRDTSAGEVYRRITLLMPTPFYVPVRSCA